MDTVVHVFDADQISFRILSRFRLVLNLWSLLVNDLIIVTKITDIMVVDSLFYDFIKGIIHH